MKIRKIRNIAVDIIKKKRKKKKKNSPLKIRKIQNITVDKNNVSLNSLYIFDVYKKVLKISICI